MNDFEIFQLQHRGMNCIGIRLPKEDERNQAVRVLTHVRWSATHRCWYAPETEALKQALNRIFFVIESKDGENQRQTGSSAIHFPTEQHRQFIARFRQYLEVKNYTTDTINNYIPALMHFLRYFLGRDVGQLTNEDLERYQMETVIRKDLSTSYQNTLISAVKLFYESVIGRKVTPEFISRPRREKPLPSVMSMEQIATLLGSVRNMKHRMMLSMIYGCGLRSGELIGLKFDDIQSTRMMIHIKAAKGKKDRLVPLSMKLLEQLRDYYKAFRPKVWLFEGQFPGAKYTKRSLQLVLKQSLKAAGLSQRFRLHDLRHSYATHQLEAGTNEHIIQKLLGHSSIKTTTIYTKVARTTLEKVYNPFDHLDL